ncbi:RcpC/CpaB family pilus assembly protein [Allosalinactinospora lopnorensis]|uniref:RcpC/CpaB family pilus assembly protein n=1 Tax=Allosalinactinospora lopnorensis TaxID=1352348 RepID=UPI000623E08B|nr:RcpC/CpaB family pilus assembly protein [Allosalinactinospora lopnorensis]
MIPRRHAFSGFLARYRSGLGALCAALALVGAVLLLRPPSAATVDVLVASRDLTALSPISEGDLSVRALPREAVPDGALRPGSEPTERSLAGPMLRGEVITTARVADPPAEAYGPGMVAAPVRIADPGVAALLGPGSRVDILAAGGDPFLADAGDGPAGPAATVAADRPVIAVPEEDGTAQEAGALILVAATPEEARALAGHAAAGHLSVSITG